MPTCFLSVVITKSEQVVPSAVAQCIVKFLTSEDMKAAEILIRLSAHFDDEMLSST
jgi:hypothetical protein